VPGARGGTGLAERWRFGAELGATLCPPKIGTLSFVRVRVCSELQLRICVWLCVPDLGGPVPDSRFSWFSLVACASKHGVYFGLRVARCARDSAVGSDFWFEDSRLRISHSRLRVTPVRLRSGPRAPGSLVPSYVAP
jgi:hypothetical protein